MSRREAGLRRLPGRVRLSHPLGRTFEDSPNQSVDVDTPETIVTEFIRAMHEWETGAFRRYNPQMDPRFPDEYDRASAAVAAEWLEVVRRHCTPGDRRIRQFGHPPKYSPQHETITAVETLSPEQADVTTRYVLASHHIDEARRYRTVLTADGWRIEERWVEYGGEWYAYL